VLEGLRFQEVDELLALISPFKNLTSLVIHDVEWGNEEFLDDDEAESGQNPNPRMRPINTPCGLATVALSPTRGHIRWTTPISIYPR
jgi:hypothetical protein